MRATARIEPADSTMHSDAKCFISTLLQKVTEDKEYPPKCIPAGDKHPRWEFIITNLF